MKIVYLSAEVYPFFKTGGLGDVMYALPQAMAKLGNDVSVIMPKYDLIKKDFTENMNFIDKVEINNQIFNFLKYEKNNVKYIFVENQHLYERGHVYGDTDEDYQYASFCESILKFLKQNNLQVDIIHCNDWQTGHLPYFLKKFKIDPFYWDMRVVYTIHNLMYQGKFNNSSFKSLGYIENNGNLNFMELGIIYSDIVNTVSKTYAQEIKYEYFAEGLEWLTSFKTIYGILNGIDTKLYDPMHTKNIYPFNSKNLVNKKKNKEALQEKFGFEKNNVLLISLISRLVEGKGLDLVSSKIETLLKSDAVQVIILGSGSSYYENYYRYLENKYPHKFKAYIGYNEELANLIYAGSDLFLMPSRYEPCGLAQMIAMRYGTIPLVRETGGLKDTVIPYNIHTDKGNGFSFTNFNADDMLYTIRYAQDIYYNHKDIWNKLVIRNMQIDNSWEKSANEYLNLYKEAKKTP